MQRMSTNDTFLASLLELAKRPGEKQSLHLNKVQKLAYLECLECCWGVGQAKPRTSTQCGQTCFGGCSERHCGNCGAYEGLAGDSCHTHALTQWRNPSTDVTWLSWDLFFVFLLKPFTPLCILQSWMKCPEYHRCLRVLTLYVQSQLSILVYNKNIQQVVMFFFQMSPPSCFHFVCPHSVFCFPSASSVPPAHPFLAVCTITLSVACCS